MLMDTLILRLKEFMENAYILFMRKYYHLHEEYLKSLMN